ncbi:unnamed protein product [Ixodes pacificus]
MSAKQKQNFLLLLGAPLTVRKHRSRRTNPAPHAQSLLNLARRNHNGQWHPMPMVVKALLMSPGSVNSWPFATDHIFLRRTYTARLLPESVRLRDARTHLRFPSQLAAVLAGTRRTFIL